MERKIANKLIAEYLAKGCEKWSCKGCPLHMHNDETGEQFCDELDNIVDDLVTWFPFSSEEFKKLKNGD